MIGLLVRNLWKTGESFPLHDYLVERGIPIPADLNFVLPNYNKLLTMVANYDTSRKERRVAARLLRKVLRNQKHRKRGVSDFPYTLEKEKQEWFTGQALSE